MSEIYVVFGQTGEYTDHRDWPVKAFIFEQSAKDFVEKVSEEYRRLKVKYSSSGSMWFWYMRDKGDFNSLDPRMETDYTGTEYYYFPVDLEE
jgi:hypothetical protein